MERQILNHRKRQHLKNKKRREEKKGRYFVENGEPPFAVRLTPSVEEEKNKEGE